MLLQGDCLTLLQELPDASVDLVLADPPYGTTNCSWDSIIPFEPLWTQLKRVAKRNAAVVLFGAQPFTSALVMSNPKMFKYEWVWVKSTPTGFLNAKKQPLRTCETISVFYADQPTYNPQMRQGFKPYACKQGVTKTDNYGKQTGAFTISDGSRYPITNLEFGRDKDKFHPTQKPVELLKYLIRTYTNQSDTVLDFSMGSGSTGVAAVELGRNFVGMELSEKYFEIAKARIEKCKKL